MASEDPLRHVWLVGAGRLGTALAAALAGSARIRRVTLSGRAVSPPEAVLSMARPGALDYLPFRETPEDVSLLILAVPDRAIGRVATELARRHFGPVPAIHTSGVLPSTVLEPLAGGLTGSASLHPLVSVTARPSAHLLQGATFGVEGSGAALAAALSIVEILKGRTLEVEASQKAAYHAAAVFASNFVVTLLGVAERLLVSAGIATDEARLALTTLAAGSVTHVADTSPLAALTGPISRGDVDTVRLHLGGLLAPERRLYSELARETLQLARLRGLAEADAAGLASLLEVSRS